VRLQPGLLGNPQSAAFCSQEQLKADTFPADSTVGSVQVTAKAHNGKEVSFEQELATPGCDPRASFSIRRNGRRAALSPGCAPRAWDRA
jgi:hypothetical protein